jgi:hypothetical protein
MDNLSTHSRGGAVYDRFEPEEARRILRKLEFHFTPKTRELVEHGGDRIECVSQTMFVEKNRR